MLRILVKIATARWFEQVPTTYVFMEKFRELYLNSPFYPGDSCSCGYGLGFSCGMV